MKWSSFRLVVDVGEGVRMKDDFKVLIIDDNPADSRRLVRLLERLVGWNLLFRECATILEGVEALTAFDPDLVFVDYQLDKGTGLDLVRQIPETLRQEVAFILLTGRGDEEVAVQSLRAGVLDYLTKDGLTTQSLEHVLRFAAQRIGDRRALRHRDAILHAITLAAETLLKSMEWRDGMRRLLAALGAAADVSRVGLWQNVVTGGALGPRMARLMFEWTVDAGSSQSAFGVRKELSYAGQNDLSFTSDLVAGRPQFLRTEDWSEEEAALLRAQGLRATVLMPVFFDQVWWGVLRFDERRPEREWTPMELDALRTAASTMGAALQREQFEEMMRLQATALETAANAIFITDAQGVFLWANPAFTRITGYGREEICGVTPRILKSGRHDLGFYQELWSTITEGHVWRGEIMDRRKDGSVYIQETTISPVRGRSGEVTRFVSVQQDVTLRKELEEKLRAQAEYDTLTGLPNRRLFEDRLIQALALAGRNEAHAVLMFLDLDRFKEVNDTLGHDAGDELLKEASRRIVTCVRRSDTVARLGGDEFTVILHDVSHPEQARLVAAKILEQLQRPFFPGGREVHVSGSIGLAVFPEDGTDMPTLVKCADEAMYRSKKAGRATFHFFNPPGMNPPSPEVRPQPPAGADGLGPGNRT
ncbi:MAG: diguanylate cyclase [Magnetococcales bacterium]|nr:diguanylate cyclase [Magnetococcales bacterium]